MDMKREMDKDIDMDEELTNPAKIRIMGGKPPDWQDFVGITTLLIINSTISFIKENNAGNVAAALMAGLAPKTKVIRDGKWNEQDVAILVPGDVISVKLGDIIPADAHLLEGDPLKIDQSTLTGESLPVTKNPGDSVYSGSTCKQDEIEVVDIATGVHTFGKASHLVESTNEVGHFQKIVELCNLKNGEKNKVFSIIDKFAERGLRSLAVS